MIDRNRHTSFGTRIDIVPLKVFNKIKSGHKIPYGLNYLSDDLVKGRDFYTQGIESCTGGVMVHGSATGWHYLDDEVTYKMLDKEADRILNSREGAITNGILIGGKYHTKDTEFSRPFFRGILKQLKEKIPALSVFEQMQKFSHKTHFHYNKEADTLTMCCVDVPKYEKELHKCVSSMKGLLKFFKRVYISEADTLYINGKEISRDKYPSKFRI